MRGLTGALIGGGLVLLVIYFLLVRSGDETTDTLASPRPGSVAGNAAPDGGGSRLGTGMGGTGSGPAARSARVEERLGALRADFEKRQLEGLGGPAASKREVPTAAARTRDMVEQAQQDLMDEEIDEDPAELEELRTTLFNDPDPDERVGAILMLTGDEGPESMRMLIEAMDDPDAEVRLAVVEALGDRSEELSPSLLQRALNDPDPEVRFEAVSILGDLDDPEAQRMVQAAKNDPDEDVRALAEGIEEFDEDDEDTAPHGIQPTARM